MKHNCKKWNLLFANAIVYLFKCFISYQPDEDPLGPKRVAVIITKNNVGLILIIN